MSRERRRRASEGGAEGPEVRDRGRERSREAGAVRSSQSEVCELSKLFFLHPPLEGGRGIFAVP